MAKFWKRYSMSNQQQIRSDYNSISEPYSISYQATDGLSPKSGVETSAKPVTKRNSIFRRSERKSQQPNSITVSIRNLSAKCERVPSPAETQFSSDKNGTSAKSRGSNASDEQQVELRCLNGKVYSDPAPIIVAQDGNMGQHSFTRICRMNNEQLLPNKRPERAVLADNPSALNQSCIRCGKMGSDGVRKTGLEAEEKENSPSWILPRSAKPYVHVHSTALSTKHDTPKCHTCGRHRRTRTNSSTHKVHVTDQARNKSSPLPAGLTLSSQNEAENLRHHVRPFSIGTQSRTSSTFATDDRPVSPVSTFEMPLIRIAEQKNLNQFRRGSVINLVRTQSSQKNETKVLSAQRTDENDRSLPPQLIKRFSNAVINADGSKYTKLKDQGESKKRVWSPLSPSNKENEIDSFQNIASAKSIRVQKRNSWEPGDETIATVEVDSPESTQTSASGTRPPLTRFRSLRESVSRTASQISRNSSLKRLGSLKGVPEMYMSSDIVVESAGFGYLR